MDRQDSSPGLVLSLAMSEIWVVERPERRDSSRNDQPRSSSWLLSQSGKLTVCSDMVPVYPSFRSIVRKYYPAMLTKVVRCGRMVFGKSDIGSGKVEGVWSVDEGEC